jgi:hypothetical protein
VTSFPSSPWSRLAEPAVQRCGRVSYEDSDALIAALHERAARVTRHRLSAAEGAALRAAVAQASRAATPDV